MKQYNFPMISASIYFLIIVLFNSYHSAEAQLRLKMFSKSQGDRKGLFGFRSIQLISDDRYPLKTDVKRKHLAGFVPIIPDDEPTPDWIPGELIATEVTDREIKMIDESEYGPLKSVTKFPALLSAILVFKKRYHPERLSEVLKTNFGVEVVPNGVIIMEH